MKLSTRIAAVPCCLVFGLVACGDGDEPAGAPPVVADDGGADDADAPDTAAEDAQQDEPTEEQPDAETDSPDDAPLDQALSTQCDEPPRDFWIYDLSVMPPTYEQRTFVCRGKGPHIRVYVDDAIWNNQLTESSVDAVLTAVESATPADPSRGIYELATSAFGEPMDVDDNGAVIVLYHEIKGFKQFEFDGYIRREDMLGGAYSNQAEVLYMDAFRNDAGSHYMLGVFAHEFAHMIQLAHDTNEAPWLEETIAEASMSLGGYYIDLDTWVAHDFAPDPTQTVVVEPPQSNYGGWFLLGSYLLERFEPAFLTALVSHPANGMASLDAVLEAQGHASDVASLMADWALANYLDAPAVGDGRYGYDSFEVPALSVPSGPVPSALTTHDLQAHGPSYRVYEVSAAANSTLRVDLDSASPERLVVRYAAYPQGSKDQAVVGQLAPAQPQSSLMIEGVGGQVDRVVVVVMEVGGSAAQVQLAAALQ